MLFRIGNTGKSGSYVVSDRKGHSEGTVMDDDITLFGKNSVIGRSMVIHGKYFKCEKLFRKM